MLEFVYFFHCRLSCAWSSVYTPKRWWMSFFFYINNHKIKYWQNMSLASLNRCFQRNNVILIWQNFCVWIAFFTASIIISVLFFLHWPNPICCRLHWSALFDPIELWTCRFLVAVIKMNRMKKIIIVFISVLDVE